MIGGALDASHVWDTAPLAAPGRLHFPVMDFTVTTHKGDERHYLGSSSYHLKDGGVLEVSDATSQVTAVFSPSGWLSVEHATPANEATI
jgi:hypothetical protein